MTRSQLLAMMDVAMGGRAAEELIFGHEKITSGASSDLKVTRHLSDIVPPYYSIFKSTASYIDRDAHGERVGHVRESGVPYHRPEQWFSSSSQ